MGLGTHTDNWHTPTNLGFWWILTSSRPRPELSQKFPSFCFTDGDAHFTAMRFSAPPRGSPGAPCLSKASYAAVKQRQGPAHDRIPLPLPASHSETWPPLRCRGCALKEVVLARYRQLTGAGHGMSLAAALDSAQHYWQFLELF